MTAAKWGEGIKERGGGSASSTATVSAAELQWLVVDKMALRGQWRAVEGSGGPKQEPQESPSGPKDRPQEQPQEQPQAVQVTWLFSFHPQIYRGPVPPVEPALPLSAPPMPAKARCYLHLTAHRRQTCQQAPWRAPGEPWSARSPAVPSRRTDFASSIISTSIHWKRAGLPRCG